MKNVTQILRQLVAINTSPGQPNAPYIELLSRLIGREPELRYDYQSNGANLTAAAWKFPAVVPQSDGARPLVFVVHTDTVQASGDWTADPWSLTIKGDKLQGLGTTDMKGGVASLLVALDATRSQLKRDVWVVADGDEETNVAGGPAIRQLLPFKEAEVVVIEPTATLIRHRQKGSMTVRVTCSGKALHASEATTAVNQAHSATEKLRLVLQSLHELESSLKPAEDLFWQPTLTVTQVTAGSSVNTVADRAELVVDRRFSPREDPKTVLSQIEAAVHRADPTARVEPEFVGGGYFTEPTSGFVQETLAIAQQVLPGFKLGDRPGWSEASNFDDLGPTLIAGPGVIGQAHQADEYTSLQSLEQYAEIYRRLIER